MGEGKGGGRGEGKRPRADARPRAPAWRPLPQPGPRAPASRSPSPLPLPLRARARVFHLGLARPGCCPFVSPFFTLSPLPRSPFPSPSPISLSTSCPPCSPLFHRSVFPSVFLTLRPQWCPQGAGAAPCPALSLVFDGGWDERGILKGEGSTE